MANANPTECTTIMAHANPTGVAEVALRELAYSDTYSDAYVMRIVTYSIRIVTGSGSEVVAGGADRHCVQVVAAK